MNTDLESKLQWLYSAKNLDELRQKYDEWASEYDKLGDDSISWIVDLTRQLSILKNM